jgi:magnesium transporter
VDPAVALREELRRLAEAGDITTFLARATELHASDLSDVLAALDPDVRIRIVRALPPESVSDALAEMEEEEHPEEVLAALRPEQAADIVQELEDDDAVDLIGELPPEKVAPILRYVADRTEIERLLEYDEDTAGGRMTAMVVSVQETATAAEAISEIRRQAEEVGEFYQVYCVDAGYRLVGMLPLQQVVVAPPTARVRDIMEEPPAVATPDLDQEEVARLMARYNLPALPVVDEARKLLGRITFDDVMDVVEAEGTEDLLKFGGVPGDEQLGGDWRQAVRSRLPWLSLNMLTAFLGGAVVYFFQHAIEGIIALAVLMPIIAGLGGNAGTQALAVTVRRIAVGGIPSGKRLRLVGKELVVGLVNGLAVGAAVAAATALVGLGWQLGMVVLLAMWGNLVLATVLGATVPLVLQRVGADPAVASSIFITAFTDVFGFLLLLGLAAAVLLPGM